MMHTLVACPFSKRKLYSLDEWEQATRGHARLMAVDEPEVRKEVKKRGIKFTYFNPVSDFRRGKNAIYGPRFNEAWSAILENADGFTHILSLESDVIPPEGVDIVDLMEHNYDGCDFLCHGYPWRYPSKLGGFAYETGCTIATVGKWREALEKSHPLQGMYGTIRNIDLFTHKDVQLVELQHLGELVDDR
jgi:hypothetical protein